MCHARSRGLRGSRRRGNVLVLVAASLVSLVGVVGLVIDGGRVTAQRRHAQNASDAAAMAAAIDLFNGQSADTARQTALTYAARNGYSNDGTTNTVVVNIPPKSGPNAGNANYVEVFATSNITTYFIKAVYSKAAQPQTRGVAGWTNNAPGNGAVYTLNNKKKKSLHVKKGDLTVLDGPIQVNSSDKKEAASVRDGATVTATATKIVGGYTEDKKSSFTPTPVTGVAPVSDPLAGLKTPSTAGLPSSSKVNVDLKKGESYTLTPGVYDGGIDIHGKGNVVMQPGIYVIQGGGFRIETEGDLAGNGVMIYNSGTATKDKDKSDDFGGFKLKVDGDFAMSGPTDGDYKGLTLFQDRDNTKTASINLKTDGQLVSGTFYVPNGRVEIKGKGTLDGAQIIANRLKIDGDGTVTLKYDASKTVRFTELALVE